MFDRNGNDDGVAQAPQVGADGSDEGKAAGLADSAGKPADTDLVVADEHIEPLSEFDAMARVAGKSLPFATARTMFAANTLAVGATVSRLGGDAVAASQFFGGLQYVLVGIPRGLLTASGILAGEKNGAQEYREVGAISRASWKIALGTSAVAIGGLVGLPYAIGATGIASPAVAQATSDYLLTYSIAVPAVLAGVAEQQIGVAAGDGRVPLGFTAVYSGVAAGVGIPMALGMMGEAVSGTRGFGIGTAISTWTALAGVRAYYACNNDRYGKYDLFNICADDRHSYTGEMWDLGWKTGLQSGAEFASTTATSFLLSAYGQHAGIPALQIVAPAMQLASAGGLVSLGFGQAQGSLISNQRGAMRKALKLGRDEEVAVGRNNIAALGRQGAVLGGALSGALALACAVKPELFVDLFLNSDVDATASAQAASVVQIGSVGLVFDMLRNLYGGNLKGFKDVNTATLISFGTMTVGFAGGAAGMLFGADMSIESVMWLRNAMVAASMIANVARWQSFGAMEASDQATYGIAESVVGSDSTGSLLEHGALTGGRPQPKYGATAGAIFPAAGTAADALGHDGMSAITAGGGYGAAMAVSAHMIAVPLDGSDAQLDNVA